MTSMAVAVGDAQGSPHAVDTAGRVPGMTDLRLRMIVPGRRPRPPKRRKLARTVTRTAG